MRLTPTRNKFKTFPTRTKLLTMHFPKKRPEDHILRHAFVLTSGIFNPILELNRNFYTACLCHNIITYFVMIKRVLCFTIPHGKFVYNISIFKDNNLRKKFRVRQTTIMIAQSVRLPSDRRVQNRQRLLFSNFAINCIIRRHLDRKGMLKRRQQTVCSSTVPTGAVPSTAKKQQRLSFLLLAIHLPITNRESWTSMDSDG